MWGFKSRISYKREATNGLQFAKVFFAKLPVILICQTFLPPKFSSVRYLILPFLSLSLGYFKISFLQIVLSYSELGLVVWVNTFTIWALSASSATISKSTTIDTIFNSATLFTTSTKSVTNHTVST